MRGSSKEFATYSRSGYLIYYALRRMKNQISALDDDMTTNRVNQFQQHAFS
jgi:hypothetical protein